MDGNYMVASIASRIAITCRVSRHTHTFAQMRARAHDKVRLSIDRYSFAYQFWWKIISNIAIDTKMPVWTFHFSADSLILDRLLSRFLLDVASQMAVTWAALCALHRTFCVLFGSSIWDQVKCTSLRTSCASKMNVFSIFIHQFARVRACDVMACAGFRDAPENSCAVKIKWFRSANGEDSNNIVEYGQVVNETRSTRTWPGIWVKVLRISARTICIVFSVSFSSTDLYLSFLF